MRWNVFRIRCGDKGPSCFNIFDHGGFRKDICEITKRCKEKDEFAEEVRKSLMYYFWCKCEYEVLISPWPYNPERDKMTKVDVYWQIRNNWDAFIAYVWEHRKENDLCHKDRE